MADRKRHSTRDAIEALHEAARTLRKKRKRMKLPNAEEVHLSSKQRVALIDEATECSYRIHKLLRAIMEDAVGGNYGDDSREGEIASPKAVLASKILSLDGESASSFSEDLLWHEVRGVASNCIDKGLALLTSNAKEPRQSNGEGAVAVCEGKRRDTTFRDWYKNLVASSFGNDIDEIRSQADFQGNEKDISLLVDALSSGASVYSEWDRRLIVNSHAMRDLATSATENKVGEMAS